MGEMIEHHERLRDDESEIRYGIIAGRQLVDAFEVVGQLKARGAVSTEEWRDEVAFRPATSEQRSGHREHLHGAAGQSLSGHAYHDSAVVRDEFSDGAEAHDAMSSALLRRRSALQ